MTEKATGPPVCVQIFSLIVLVIFGVYSIVKGVSFGLFNWWYILGASCIMAAAFASFRIYEICILEARKETSSEL